MAFNTFKCNRLTPLPFKGLTQTFVTWSWCKVTRSVRCDWFQTRG